MAQTQPTRSPAAAEPAAGSAGLTETERDQIRRRAHAIWREEGYPQGRDREHWERAQMQVLKGRRPY
ncbi:DUF2934 domain-containing protein [Xanthobacter sp. AM11]|uniref:DUF2934 domain-containing protein n=1 Tax=Xanthobacter sp. AM11 TaxID=3380643 RepID=UPI0039BEDA29